MKRCPKCKGTKFSIKIWGFQEWDSEEDDYGLVEVQENITDETTIFCVGCEETYKHEHHLEDYDSQ